MMAMDPRNGETPLLDHCAIMINSTNEQTLARGVNYGQGSQARFNSKRRGCESVLAKRGNIHSHARAEASAQRSTTDLFSTSH